MKFFRLYGLILLFFPMMVPGQSELAGDSVYQVGGQWQTQQAESLELTELMGKQQVVSLIYTHCEHVCPVIVSSMKKIEALIPPPMRNEVGFVLITFTPETDTPDVLAKFAGKHDLSQDSWMLLRSDNDTIRNMAMVLGIKYQRLDNNEVNHSNLISVLDKQGRLAFQESGALRAAPMIAERLVYH